MQMKLAIINEAAGLGYDFFIKCVIALRQQVERDLEPRWGSGAYIYVPQGQPTPGTWTLRVTDIEPSGVVDYGPPTAINVAKGDMWTVTASRLIVDTVVNPGGAGLAVVNNSIVKIEPCAPVAGSVYRINGVFVSNFVFPSWYQPEGTGPFDHGGELSEAGELATDGYLTRLTPEGWVQG
jgi:hypothetical protein